MEFTNQQKLIVALLTEIHSSLKIEDGLDPEFVQRMVSQGQGWALSWKYSGLFDESGEDPESVKFVADVLDMWSLIEAAVEALDAEGRQTLAGATPFGRDVRFPGFDGNHENDYLSIARIFVNDLERWSEFTGRVHNSHMRTVDGYQRMLEVFGNVRDVKMDSGDYGLLNVEELIQILGERTHPANR